MPIRSLLFRRGNRVLNGLPALAAVLVFSAGSEAVQAAPAAVADISGVERFLALTATLEKDQEPTPEQWDALFATPGYAVLLKREFQRDFFVERFRLAFMPSLAETLKEQMKKDTGFRAQFLPHYLRVKDLRGRIERWASELRPAELYAEAAQRAQAFLPSGEVADFPSVAFVVFAPDFRGYDPVVLDVLYCMDQGGALADVVGHEFHHYYRNRLVDLGQDQSTLWILNQIHAEGIADLIDKAGWIRKPDADLSPAEKEYIGFYRETPAVLRTMDGLLARMNGMATGRGELGFELRRAVPKVGHPTGLYMATLILEVLGRDALIAAATDPFAFFRLFQDAAVRKGGGTVVFSADAMAFLDKLARCR